MFSKINKTVLVILSLGVLMCLPIPLVGQSLSFKSGSFIEQRIPKGHSQKVQVIDPRGLLQWQVSSDGADWHDWVGQNRVSLLMSVNSVLFLRCAIQEANCAPVYSDVVKLIPFDVAILTTSEISNIEVTSASGGGNVISDENATVTERGICWSTSTNPTTSDNKTTNGAGTGAFTSSLINLTGNTTYYVRAYAVNVAGTSYGNEVSFKTSPILSTVTTSAVTSIAQTTAVSGGNVTDDGGAGITGRGVCWSTLPNPSTTESRTTDGTGTGIFTSNLTGLTGNTTYYVRAYAISSVGTSYGSEIIFKTSPVLPVIATTTVSAITQTSASSGGNITSDGGASVTARGVCWSTSANPTTANNKSSDGSGTGSFTSRLTNLVGNTTYYLRAYSTNSAGTSYGNEVHFKTSPVLPTVITSAVTDIAQTTAYSGGNVTSDGGANITARGVCWSTTTNPTTSGSKTNDGIGTGSFTSSLTSLTGNTTYYLRAYSTNSAGTSYGNEVTFKTSPLTPTISTTAVSAITQFTASSGGNITGDGGASITSRGVCWSSTTALPSTDNFKTTDGTGTGSFSSSLISLTANTLYYVRAYATNSAGTAYGSSLTFTTLKNIILPVVTTGTVSAITQTTAICGGNVSSDGNEASTSRGVCWSTSANPTISGSKTSDGTGIGSFTSSLTGLTGNTTYYVRAYASNSFGTAYGEQIEFITSEGTLYYDGRAYAFKNYGTQTWMVENLAYLPAVSPPSVGSETSPYYYVYGYTGSDIVQAKTTMPYNTYGVYYNWEAAKTACPSGWHLPSDEDWKTLEKYFGMSSAELDLNAWRGTTALIGKKMKSVTGWKSNGNGDNSTGFNALPAGSRLYTTGFMPLGEIVAFWTSTASGSSTAWDRGIYYSVDGVHRTNINNISNGISVRCCQSYLASVTTAAISLITPTTAVSGGNAILYEGANITVRGVCWSTSQNPTTDNDKSTDGSGTGSFISSLTGLSANTTYYVRAYATNSSGTAYGNEVSFKTSPGITTITTATVSAITQTTASSGGNITSQGGANVTVRGVCWSTSANPTTSGSKTTDGSGFGSYTSSLTSLTGNTTYYVRAYYTSVGGTFYGNEVSFKTSPVMPTVTTAAVTFITPTSATSGGNVTNDGGESIGRGVCWSTSANPTIADLITSDGSGTGSFTSSLTGLTGSTVYYLRAYATNPVGTAYGDQVVFTTPEGTFDYDGRTYGYKTYGSQTWMVENLAYLPAVSPPSIGSESAPYYYVYGYTGSDAAQAKATLPYAAYGVYYNWEASKISCPSGWHLPSDEDWKTLEKYLGMTTAEANLDGWRGVTGSVGKKMKSASGWISNGNGDNSSGFSALPAGVRLYTTGFMTLGEIAGFWTSNASGSSTAWDRGIYYGSNGVHRANLNNISNALSVRCCQNLLATVTTAAISLITPTTAVSGGNAILYEGANITERGVCWSTSQNPTTGNDKTTDGSGPGSFISSLSGLAANTTYYVRAYATNSSGTAYGNEVSFKTSQGITTITTTTVTNITQTTASSGGNITSEGGASVAVRGVCWSTSTNPTTSGSKTTDGSGLGSYTSSLTNLTGNTTYYVRAYYTSGTSTFFGNEISFKTSPVMPAVTTAAVTFITPTTATSGGNVTNDGGESIGRGVCWSTSANPTILDHTTSDGSGTGSFTSSLEGLTGSTVYYLRAYTTNPVGTAYGDQVVFTTPEGTFDYDGRTYGYKTYGSQTWMVENLAYLPAVSPPSIGSESAPYYYVFGYTGSNAAQAKTTLPYAAYGVYYNWEASKTACPSGWNLPSDEDWKTLEKYLGMNPTEANLDGWRGVTGSIGKKMKSASGWISNGNGDNSSGFSALPAGARLYTTGFMALGEIVAFWTSTASGSSTAWDRGLYYSLDGVHRTNINNISNGLSVRCFQSGLATVTTTSVSDITPTTATSGGNATTSGAGITARGVCWSTSQNPTTANSSTSDGSGSGSFISSLTGLAPNTPYYVRAYATNGAGTAYGDQVSFTTSPAAPIADFTGNPLTVCEGSTVTLTNSSTGTTGTTTYSWDFGSGATPAAANTVGPHSVTYSSAGLKTVSLTIIDGASNTKTKTDYITVNSIPSAPTANATQSFNSVDSPTVANLVTLTGSDIKWYAAETGGTALAASTPLATATDYYASQTVNGCESSLRIKVTVTII